MKYVLIFICLFYVCRCGIKEDFLKIDALRLEEPCSNRGGMCTFAADCPRGMLVETPGLCPEQQTKGVECCYGLSVKETRCQKHGGTCMRQEVFCNRDLTYHEATDCASGTKCCILV